MSISSETQYHEGFTIQDWENNHIPFYGRTFLIGFSVYSLVHLLPDKGILWHPLSYSLKRTPPGDQLTLVLVCPGATEWRWQGYGHQGELCKPGNRVQILKDKGLENLSEHTEKLQLLLNHKHTPYS